MESLRESYFVSHCLTKSSAERPADNTRVSSKGIRIVNFAATRKSAKSHQRFEADIARLVKLALPIAPNSCLEQLAVQNFIDIIKDSVTQQSLRLARLRRLDDVLAHAQTTECDVLCKN